MSFELYALVFSVVLLLAQITIQASYLTRELGTDYNASPRDEERPLGVMGGRAKRMLANYLETYPGFVALVLVVAVAGASDWLTQWGAGLYLAARIAYVPLYLGGVPIIRSLAWLAAGVGLVLMIVGLLF